MDEVDSDFAKALRDATRLLRYSDRFEVELIDRLISKGHSPKVASEVTAYLKRERLLNDDRTAQELVERSERRKEGPLGLKLALQKRGLPEQDVDELLHQVLGAVSSEDKRRRAEGLLESKPELRQNAAKAARALAARGFEEETIREVIESLGTEWDNDG